MRNCQKALTYHMRLTAIAIITCIAILTPLKTLLAADYTGIWKEDCSSFYGLQIKKADAGRYSICFCALRGCMEPQRWASKTPIDQDPNYTVISDDKIIISCGADKKCIYKKCTADPSWVTLETIPPQPGAQTDCPFSKDTGKTVLIAWVTQTRETTQQGPDITTQAVIEGSFQPLVILAGTTLVQAYGNTIFSGQPFWQALSPKAAPIRLSSPSAVYDNLNDGRCTYSASIRKRDIPAWTLLTSSPLPSVFRKPNPKDTEKFIRLRAACPQQEDTTGEEPYCAMPTLLAVTDINKDGNLQYWATEPYLWDTGLTVWEEKKGKLVPLVEVCVNCNSQNPPKAQDTGN